MSPTGMTSASNMSHKRVFNEFVADDSATTSPSSKRSKISEIANKIHYTALPNERQLKAPGMNVQPLELIRELNYQNTAASSHPVNGGMAGAQMPSQMASSKTVRTNAAAAQSVRGPADHSPVHRRSTKTIRAAAAAAMQNPAPPQPFGISLARLDSPLGLFDQHPFWNSMGERQMHLERIRAHDDMIREFIWLLAPHDVQISSASPEAQSRACGIYYDCIMGALHTQYSDVGLGFAPYSWAVKPSDKMLLQHLEADTYMTVNALGRGRTSLMGAKGHAKCRQEHFFLLATSFVFSSIMKLLVHRSRRDLLIGLIDRQAWSWARSCVRLILENTEQRSWPSKHTDNFFVGLMAATINNMTLSNMPTNCSGKDVLQGCLCNALLISQTLEQDTLATNAVEGITIDGPLHRSIESLLEPIKADLRGRVGRMRAELAAHAAQAMLNARAQRQAQIQAQYRAAQQQQRILAGRVPAQQGEASGSQTVQGISQPLVLTPAPLVAQSSQHRSRHERAPTTASSTPVLPSQPVPLEASAPRKRKRTNDEAIDADAGSSLKKSRYDQHQLPSKNFPDIEGTRSTEVASIETASSTETTFEHNASQSRSDKSESHWTTADQQPPVGPGVTTFTEFLNSTNFDDQTMDQWFDFSAASSDDSSNTEGSANGLVPTNDTPLDGSNMNTFPAERTTIDHQNHEAFQPPGTVRGILRSDNGSNVIPSNRRGTAIPDDVRTFREATIDDSYRPLGSQDEILTSSRAPASRTGSRSSSNTSHLSNEEFLDVLDEALEQTRDSISMHSR